MMWFFFWVLKLEDFVQVLWMILDLSVEFTGKLNGNDWPAKSPLDWVRENARFTSLLLFYVQHTRIGHVSDKICRKTLGDSNARIHGRNRIDDTD